LKVLGIYPSTIRRRILRHLYLDQLHKCFLFADCKLKFLDALLAGARVELFMPQVRSRRHLISHCLDRWTTHRGFVLAHRLHAVSPTACCFKAADRRLVRTSILALPLTVTALTPARIQTG